MKMMSPAFISHSAFKCLLGLRGILVWYMLVVVWHKVLAKHILAY